MPWPIESDYFEAVQNPQICFSDPELKNGTPALSHLGLPKPITGAFASVYEVKTANKRWAVRCFLREYADQQQRYEAISTFLRSANLPYTVAFDFIRKGILVRGSWYPILKMEWIEGETLGMYVERHLNTPAALAALSRQWIAMSAALHKAGLAHGDLQHGNVIVSNGQIRLIDYDGMFVPTLRGMQSHEEGHRNYQHPRRTSKDFDANADNFSEWVIFVSLAALAVRPNLWQQLNGGDECLLFRRTDFEHPNTSKAIAALDKSGSPELQALAARFRSIIHKPLQQIPMLDGTSVATTSNTSSAANRPDWLNDHVPTASREGEGLLKSDMLGSDQAEPFAGASWIVDHLIGNENAISPLDYGSFVLERCVVLVLMLMWLVSVLAAMFAGPYAMAIGIADVLMASVVLGSFYFRYNRHPLVRDRAVAEQALRASKAVAADAEQAIATRKKEWRKSTKVLVELDAAYRKAAVDAAAKHATADKSLEETTRRKLERLDSIQKAQDTELRRATQTITNTLQEVTSKQSEIDRNEQLEKAALLQIAQDDAVSSALRSARIIDSNISGIGDKLKASLHAHGFITAADINYNVQRVPNIGPNKAATLVGWRSWITQKAKQNVSVDYSTTERIRQKYASMRQTATREAERLRSSETSTRISIQNRFVDQYANVERQFADQEKLVVGQKMKIDTDTDGLKLHLKQQFERQQAALKGEAARFQKDLTALQEQLFKAKMVVGKAGRDLERFKSVNFRKYVMAVVGLSAAA